ncbi:MAG: PepSY domain-containing protein [Rhizobiaceae bacterium]|nr:PepSY domain-containing protein [Rhizobiaceae bacterium]
MLKSIIIAGTIALASSASILPSTAQGIEIGRDGIRLQEPQRERVREGDRREVRRAKVTERDAVRIARGEGVRDVEDIRTTRSAYRIEGLDRRGDDIRVDVDRRSGDVLSVQ